MYTTTCARTAGKLNCLLAGLALLLAACQPGTSSEPPDTGRRALAVLTLNLHTYQEFRSEGVAESELTDELAQERIELYGPLFDRIAAAITDLDPDVICFQEVGEWPGGNSKDPDAVRFGSSDSNMTHQVLRRLDEPWFYTMDWSHYGFDAWLEGSAILSKYPLVDTGSRFISNPENGRHEFWKSRNVPMARIDSPGAGRVNVFSVHTGWWDDDEDPFQAQYRKLLDWAAEVAAPGETTILCGDFNVPANSSMQAFMTDGTGYSDQYALANPGGAPGVTIGAAADGWESSNSGQRVDYILMNDDSPLEVAEARIIFTEDVYGIVSDHAGIYARFDRRIGNSLRE